MGSSLRVVAALLFGSGFAALVYQTAWQRMFRLTFGASTAASAAVLAIFLGGLGLGGLLLGKRVERSVRPLIFYGNLELGISVLALLSPLLCDVVHRLYLGLGGTQTLGTFGATVVRLLLTTLVIGPAAVLMGGTLPAAARAVVSESDESRRGLAFLYSLNTVGAVAGALVGPLLLFGLLGTQLTLWGAACVNLLVAVLARTVGRRAPALPAPDNERGAEEASPSAPASPPAPPRLIYAVAALVGFAFLGLELVWYRVLAPLLGGSTLTFGLILACALCGIGIGGYLFSLRSAAKPATLRLLAITLSLEALCVIVPFAWGDGLAMVAAHLRYMANLGFGHLLAGWIFVAAVVVLPGAIVSGYQFPALFALLGRGRSQVGQQVGRAYAFNTIGTLSGSLLVGFVLLPSLGAMLLWRGLAAALALSGLVCAVLAVRSGEKRRSLAVPALLSAAAFVLCGAQGPGSMFRHVPIGAGRFDIATYSHNRLIAFANKVRASVVWERDGVESAVAIRVEDGLSFVVNGKSDGAVVGDRSTQVFLGLLPAALHGKTRSAFVVGLGTGMSAGLLARVPGVERVDVAELEPSVLEVARRAAAVNGDILANPKVSILHGDGRELLLTSKRSYDLIVSEPSNPYRAGVASLFTREFYEAAASRLNRGGLLAQWLQGYEIDAPAISTAVTTLQSVFPYVSLWGPQGNDLILLASFEPQRIELERLARDLSQPLYLEWMRRAWGMEGAEGLIAHHLASAPALADLVKGLPSAINTDDVNVLELAFARGLHQEEYGFVADLFRSLPKDAHKPEIIGSVDWERVEELRHRADWSDYRGTPITPRARAVLAGCHFGKMVEAQRIWPDDVEARDVVEIWVRGMTAAMRDQEAALGFAERLAQAGFAAESLMIRSRLAEARKDPEAAIPLLIAALEELRKTPLPLCDANVRAIRRADTLAAQVPARAHELLEALARGPFAIMKDEWNRLVAVNRLGASSTDPARCVAALGPFRALPLWELGPLASRAQCLERAGAPDAAAARADWLAFRAHQPIAFHETRPLAKAAEHDSLEDSAPKVESSPRRD